MDITKLRKNTLFVGRAATAIYLILDSLMKKKEVILPSNVCYAAVYPILYSDNTPVFVDIQTNTGNALFEDIIKLVNHNTGAIIFPYMYGNVNSDIIKISNFCKSHNIILIEDCASAMGATVLDHQTGTIGDYAIFSTGHAKIVDVGNGGLLETDEDITDIIDKNNKLNQFNQDIEKRMKKFSNEYRKLRNLNDYKELKNFFNNDYKELFIYKLDDGFDEKMIKEISNIRDNNLKRMRKYKIYTDNLKVSDKYNILDFEKGSNPWRFTILINSEENRKKIIKELLENGLFVSDWYPCIGKYFSNKTFPNADYMEKRILNFSLTDNEDRILKTCWIINKYL